MEETDLTARKAVFEACNVLWASNVKPTVEEIKIYWEVEWNLAAETLEEQAKIEAYLKLNKQTIATYLQAWQATSDNDRYLYLLNNRLDMLRRQNRKLREQMEKMGVDLSSLQDGTLYNSQSSH